MSSCTQNDFTETMRLHGGLFANGSHQERYSDDDCPLCLLEMIAACEVRRGLRERITDDPKELDLPDVRPINDACWSSREVATPHLERLRSAIMPWREWDEERRRKTADRLAILAVNKIVAELPRLSDSVRQQCRDAKTLQEARGAARSSSSSASRAAASDQVLVKAINEVWIPAFSDEPLSDQGEPK